MTSGEPRASPERDIPGLFVVPNTRKSDLHMFYSADKAEEALAALCGLLAECGKKP